MSDRAWEDVQAAHERTLVIQNLEQSVTKLLEKVAQFEVRLQNMANRLDAHEKEPDAHNPGTMVKKSK